MEAKVLVVDDEVRTLRLMEAMLVPAGYSVILAENGTDAITKAILTSPDVILLDVMMPVMNGFEVARQLRECEQTKDIPIVMVTALGEVKYRVTALESGADDFLTKPVDEAELLTRVRTLIEKSERIRQPIVSKKRSLVPIVSIIVAIIMAVASTVLVIRNKSTAETEAVYNLYQTGFQAGLEEGSRKQIEYRDVVHVEKEIEYRDVVREVVKTETVEKPIEQKEFASLEELKKWLASAVKVTFVFVGPDGTKLSSNQYDCDDYALDLQKRALKDGYLMSASIIEKGAQLHMINLVTIGNDVYYIEPQTNEVWFYCNRD